MNYTEAKNNLISAIPNSKWFEKNNYPLEYAYSLVLEGTPKKALSVLNILAIYIAKMLKVVIFQLLHQKENVICLYF